MIALKTSEPPPTPAPAPMFMPSPVTISSTPGKRSIGFSSCGSPRKPSAVWSRSQYARPSGFSYVANVLPSARMGQRRPRSSTSVVMPAWPSRSAATEPPNPLPMTIAVT